MYDKRKESSGAGLKVARRSFCSVFHEDFCFSELDAAKEGREYAKKKTIYRYLVFHKTLAFLIIT